jgi:bleomycin hydrolase
MFVVYYEYLLKAKRCIQTKDTAALNSEGSEANAVKRIIKMYGIVPEEVFIGKPANRVFYNHDSLVKSMKTYFRNLKRSKLWDEQKNIDSVEAILHKYIGIIPKTFQYEGHSYTPLSFLSFLQFKPDDYIDILSYKQDSFFKMVEYKVPDNWWHDSTYYNVPVDTFMVILKNAIKKGYTVCIGGDVSEAGFNRFTQCALVPSFDIPPALINDDARQFRFSNQTTTDDHGMHVVGYTVKDGKTWFLLKDSGSGSRNNDITKPEFGYFFVSEDYVKLKMMDFQVHRKALEIDN